MEKESVVLWHEFEEMNEGASQLFALVAKCFSKPTQHPTPNNTQHHVNEQCCWVFL
jgi:hypothetical protein